MKIKQSREFFLNLYQSLGNLGDLRGVKFAFTINRNREAIKPILKKVQELSKTKDNFKEYDKVRVALNEKHAEKDKDGKSVVEGDHYKIVDKDAFDKELELIKETFKEAITEREADIEGIKLYLKAEIDMELRPLSLDIMPSDITVDQMEILSVLIPE